MKLSVIRRVEKKVSRFLWIQFKIAFKWFDLIEDDKNNKINSWFGLAICEHEQLSDSDERGSRLGLVGWREV